VSTDPVLKEMKVWIAKIGLPALALTAAACTPNQRIINSAPETPVPITNSSPAAPNFENDLQAMRNADFKFIVAFRRKDGGVMTSEDKSFTNTITGYNANRRRLSDEGRAIIIGTNFPFSPDMLEKMQDRFAMENYSKPDSGPLVSNAVQNNSNSVSNRSNSASNK
jgi:hypothetical protein